MRKQLHLLLASALLLAVTSCKKGEVTQTVTMAEEGTKRSLAATTQLFKSDFNSANSAISYVGAQTDDITGANNIAAFPWSGSFGNALRISYESGDNTTRKAAITTDDAPNTSEGILKFSIWDAKYPISFGTYKFKQRIQTDLFDYKDPVSGSATYGNNLKEFYQKVTIKLHASSFNKILADGNRLTSTSYDWLTLFELFNGVNSTFTDYSKAYRVGMNLEKSTDLSHFVIKIKGEQYENGDWSKTSPNNWEQKTTDFYIVPGRWYTYETYIKEGQGGTNGTGRYWLKITDNTNQATAYLGSTTVPRYTQSSLDASSDGFDKIYPMKLYTSGDIIKCVNPKLSDPNAPALALQVYFGSYELWNQKP